MSLIIYTFEVITVFTGKTTFYNFCKTVFPKRNFLLKPLGSPRQGSSFSLKCNSTRRFNVWPKVPPSSHGGAVQHSTTGLFSGQAWVASWGLLFLLPQSRLEKISPRLAGNHPYHTRKRQQYREFNDRSNCCGSPTLCCGGVMNDNHNALRCEEICCMVVI